MTSGKSEPADEDAVSAQWQMLWRLMHKHVGCPATAADIVQDVYLRWFSLSDRQRVRNPGGYLYRAAVNLAAALGSQRARERELIHGLESRQAKAGIAPDQAYEGVVRLRRLLETIDALPPRCREVFLLYRFENLRQAEIAQRLGISVNMVEKHVLRAMHACRETLSALDD